MAQHTPGEWYAVDEWIQAGRGDDAKVIGFMGGSTLPPEEAAANIRVIIAAPDLLDVCSRLLKSHDAVLETSDWEHLNKENLWWDVIAAVRKAVGMNVPINDLTTKE